MTISTHSQDHLQRIATTSEDRVKGHAIANHQARPKTIASRDNYHEPRTDATNGANVHICLIN